MCASFVCLFVCCFFLFLLLFGILVHAIRKRKQFEATTASTRKISFVSPWRWDAFHVYIFIHPRVCVPVSQHRKAHTHHTPHHTEARSCIHIHWGVDPYWVYRWRKNHMYKHQAHRHPYHTMPYTRWCSVVCTVYAVIHELNKHTFAHTPCKFSMNACFVFRSVSLPRCLCLVHTFC